ncbi:hypothetical protein ACSBR2_039490 [Camellia fascicularis]
MKWHHNSIAKLDQIESLYQEFGFLRRFLKDWEDKLSEAKEVSNMDTYTSGKVNHVCYLSLNLGNFKKEIEAIKIESTEIYGKKSHDIEAIQERKPSGGDFSRAKSIVEEEEIVVGFEDEALLIKDRLTRDQKQLDTISIVGMPGQGKTTLAKKVYNDPLIIYHFHIRAWINVFQEYRERDVRLRVSSLVTCKTPQSQTMAFDVLKGKKEVKEMSDEELADKLRTSLKSKRYLIVTDDIWDTRA